MDYMEHVYATYRAGRRRFAQIEGNVDDRIRGLLRVLARDVDSLILRHVGEDTYQKEIRRFRREINDAFRRYSRRQVRAVTAGQQLAARLGASNAREALERVRRLIPRGDRFRVDLRVGDITDQTLNYLARNPHGAIPLSERVWQVNNRTMGQLFSRVQRGVLMGTSPADISLEIRENLIDPQGSARQAGIVRGLRTRARKARAAGETDRAKKLFGSARTREANLPKPGRGVYRSAYMNAMRVTRSELIRAHQEASYRWGQKSRHVVAFDFRPTPGTDCEVCLGLAGLYDKNSVPSFPHPHCMCRIVPVLDPDFFRGTSFFRPLGELRSAPASAGDPRTYYQRQVETEIAERRATA